MTESTTPATPADADVRARVAALLASERDRGVLLRQLDSLASARDTSDAFGACADLWAPALFERDPGFVEHFLLRYLHDDQADVIRALLPRAEAAGQDALFTGLYRKIAEEGDWNAEALALARATEPDAAVLRALDLRDPGGALSFTLGEEPALALYQRNAALFTPFILAHAQRHWNSDDHGFTQLRAEAQRRGDGATYWALFREWAEPSEWAAELRTLLKHPVPPSEILGALRLRQPRETDELDAGIFADFIEQYGAAVVPYVEENLDWINQRQAARLLPAIQRVGDEALYWRIFFRAGNAKQWNESLRALLDERLSDDALARALQRRTPPRSRPGWSLDTATALRLYERNGPLFRPFLERALDTATLPLFAVAERAGDEDFADFLTARFLLRMPWLVARGYPTRAQSRWQKPNVQAREQLIELAGVLTARFNRLHDELPTKYAHHAASSLSRFGPTDPGLAARDIEHNPAVAYLFSQHHDAWCQSAHAIRELLESPNTRVQLLGLTLLSLGGDAAAVRVRENLVPLRALLLSQSSRVVKRQALACLAQAGRQSAALAAQVLPMLEDTLYFRGKHALDEAIMVDCVRLKAFWAAQPPATRPA